MRLPSISTLGLTLALVTTNLLGDSPRFAPAEKSTLTKTFKSEMKVEASSVTMLIDGKEIPSDKLGDVAMSLHSTAKVKVTDRYIKVGKGRPLELDRKFDELVDTSDESTQMLGMKEAQAKTVSKSSALEGKTVHFAWKEKDDSYDTTFAGEEGDKELLKGLREDLDVRGFLPEGDVKEGDTWDVDGKLFDALVEPGGDLHFKADNDDEGKDKKKSDSGRQLAKNLAGKAQLKFERVREVDGRKVAVISLEAELTSHQDDDKSNADVTKLELKFDLKGEMLWALAESRIESLDVRGKTQVDMSVDRRGEKHTIHMQITLDGDVSLGVETGG